MTRQYRKKPSDTPMLERILLWVKSKPVYAVIGVLLFIALILSIFAIRNSYKKEIVAEPPQVVSTNTNTLEILIEKQSVLISTLEKNNENLDNNIKSLEKRLQAHTDLMKRMCEYIIVITVDKKIIPRQCLPEYKWTKEEGQ